MLVLSRKPNESIVIDGNVTVGQEPPEFGAGEVWIEDETRTTANLVLMASILERSAERLRSTILPDDCSVDRLQRIAIPEDDGLALVGESHRSDLGTGCGLECLSSYSTRHVPNLGRVMLYPTRTREMLRKLGVSATEHATIGTDDEAGTARRSLIDGEDGGDSHEATPWSGA